MKPHAIVITGYGINCEEETAKMFEWSGAQATIVHINDLIAGDYKLSDYQIMAVPGGFSYGDDTGSGNALANKIKNNIGDELVKFCQEDKLVIGICNGFQILTNLGIIPAIDNNYNNRTVALMHNKTTRYESRWVSIKRWTQKSPWLTDIDVMRSPIAHGEGNFYTNDETYRKLKENDQIAFKYVNEDGSLANGQFPANPNGAMDDVAGIIDPSGRVLGMMPHPERFNCSTNEEGWPLKKEQLLREGKSLPKQGEGIKIFENGVKYFS